MSPLLSARHELGTGLVLVFGLGCPASLWRLDSQSGGYLGSNFRAFIATFSRSPFLPPHSLSHSFCVCLRLHVIHVSRYLSCFLPSLLLSRCLSLPRPFAPLMHFLKSQMRKLNAPRSTILRCPACLLLVLGRPGLEHVHSPGTLSFTHTRTHTDAQEAPRRTAAERHAGIISAAALRLNEYFSSQARPYINT